MVLPGVVNGFSPFPGFMFNVGQGFEKSEELSGSSIAAKNVVGRGKIVSGRFTIKKGSEERESKPCSSMDSDLRSSDFVFSSGAEKDERLMMNHIAEGQAREQVQRYSRSENGGKGEDDDESKENNNHSCADSIRSLAVLQEALWEEVTSFQELSEESIPQHSDIDEVNSGSQVLILKQKVKHLQHKLEEARADLDAKEARIQELENLKIESELESIFQRKIEAEIEHLMLTRSLSSSLQVLKEQPKNILCD